MTGRAAIRGCWALVIQEIFRITAVPEAPAVTPWLSGVRIYAATNKILPDIKNRSVATGAQKRRARYKTGHAVIR